MRILIENGSHHLQNLGDLAMLQVAVKRFNRIFDRPQIYVVTDLNWGTLNFLLPGTEPISNKVKNSTVSKVTRKLSNLITGHEYAFDNDLIDCVENYVDLVVTSGGGYLVEPFKYTAMQIVDVLALAQTLKKPTAILGHGFGKIYDKELKNKFRRWLPKVDQINIREGTTSSDVLFGLDVDPERVINTGDDAIELAFDYYQKYGRQPQEFIGVNLRMSSYAHVNNGAFNVVKNVLTEYSKNSGKSLIPCPISLVPEESDLLSVESMGIAGYYEELNSPEKVIKQIAKCQFVVTGSYHAGVFALSQGIPIIALTSSQYYCEKFNGLLNQFTYGNNKAGKVINLNSQSIRRQLEDALEWVSTKEHNKLKYLEYAEKQVNSGITAYNKIASLT
jgi:polysaccharide pyruvyl transferase WcaK-like protein